MLKKRKVFQISNALAEGLEDTIKAAETYNGQLRVEVVPLRKIELDNENPRDLALLLEDLPDGPLKTDPLFERKINEKENLMSMAKSIDNEGIINPIVVYKAGEKYRVIAGERRTLASKLAGKIDIPAKILSQKPSEYKLSLLQWLENIEREDLTLWERMRNLQKIIHSFENENKLPSINATTLGKILGCSIPQAMNYLSALSGDESLIYAIKNNQVKNLEKAAFIARIEEINIRQEALAACIGGASLSQLKKITENEKKNKLLMKSLSRIEVTHKKSKEIKLGSTNRPDVVKKIINSILKNEEFKNFNSYFETVNWNDFSLVSKAFHKLIKALEDMES